MAWFAFIDQHDFVHGQDNCLHILKATISFYCKTEVCIPFQKLYMYIVVLIVYQWLIMLIDHALILSSHSYLTLIVWKLYFNYYSNHIWKHLLRKCSNPLLIYYLLLKCPFYSILQIQSHILRKYVLFMIFFIIVFMVHASMCSFTRLLWRYIRYWCFNDVSYQVPIAYFYLV